jgi:hypothetical protein
MTTASKEDIQHMRPKQRNKYLWGAITLVPASTWDFEARA